MLKIYVWLADFVRSERGQDMVEYSMTTVLISVAIVLAAMLILEPAFTGWAEDLGRCLTRPGRGSCVRLVAP